jgi:type IV pilus assembly protein PilC
MISFHYTAVDGNGREVRGEVLAASRDDATERVRRLGVFPVDVVDPTRQAPAATNRPPGAGAGQRLFAPRLAGRRLAIFTRQLATLLYAGMPLVRAMHLLEQQAQDGSERRVIADVVGAVEGGANFSEALSRQPRTFSRLYISMVRAGEASGQLEAVLRRQAELMEKQRRLVRQVRGALAYPAVVCVVAGLITTGLMIFIVPKFAAMFTEMLGGSPLPALTRMVIAASNTMLHQAYLLVAAALAAMTLWKLIRVSRVGAYWTDRAALGLPGLGAMLRLSACVHFCSTLGTLTRSGVPILAALQIVRDGTRNRVLTLAVERVRDAVKDGEPISGTMKRTGAFPAMLVGMVQVGEETGSLPEMLERVAQTYEEEVDAAVESLTSMIEPLLIVVLAGIVGTIVIALFLPLLKIALVMSGSN